VRNLSGLRGMSKREGDMLDDEYANAAHIPGGDGYYDRWDAAAAAFREGHRLKELGVAYGSGLAQTYDLFHPERLSKGTVVFVHGGYWLAGSPRMFSHLAAGAVAAGYGCAMVGYTLAPAARISEITAEVAAALGAIAKATEGPLYLVGHSAGGHLVARMGCADMMGAWGDRVARIMPISPLSDLAPLMETSMNAELRLDAQEAARESPLSHDAPACPVTVVVGSVERPAFLDQAKWLVDRWGAPQIVEEGKHHFDVIEGLEDPESAMMRALVSK